MPDKWGDIVSGPFGVSNGVSVLLILICMLVICPDWRLDACQTGFIFGDMVMKHEMVAFSPSSTGLQQLLNICTDYGIENDIKYNASPNQ